MMLTFFNLLVKSQVNIDWKSHCLFENLLFRILQFFRRNNELHIVKMNIFNFRIPSRYKCFPISDLLHVWERLQKRVLSNSLSIIYLDIFLGISKNPSVYILCFLFQEIIAFTTSNVT